MKELSLNILDIAQNSIKADASLIEIRLTERDGCLTLVIRDNGCGMSPEFAREVCDPFRTTRTTRKVGMGLPLLKLAAEQAGGGLSVESTERAVDPAHGGTAVKATFDMRSIDFTPIGDVVSTVILLIQGSPDVDFLFIHDLDGGRRVELDTRQMRQMLGPDVPLNTFEVLEWARASLEEQYAA